MRNMGSIKRIEQSAGRTLPLCMPSMEFPMKNSTFTVDQIIKLREIEKARVKNGEPGFRQEIQALITRLTSGGVGIKTDDLREAQAKCLWDKGFGEKFDSFESFLSTIPEIPEKLKSDDQRFPLLVLVDARLGVTKSCGLAGLKYAGNNQTFEDFDPKKARTEQVYWMRARDGRKNLGKTIKTCRENFSQNEIGLTALEGVALYLQNPKVINGHCLDLPGSVPRGGRGTVAGLGYWDDGPGLRWYSGAVADPHYGSASRSE